MHLLSACEDTNLSATPKQAEQATRTIDNFTPPAANDSGNDILMAIIRDRVNDLEKYKIKKQQNMSAWLDVDFEKNNPAGV